MCIALDSSQRRGLSATFQSGDQASTSSHELGYLPLHQSGASAGWNQFSGHLELICHGFLLGTSLGVGEQFSLQCFQCFHVCASNRLSAVAIATRGVALVFFTKTCSTSRQRSRIAAYSARAIPSRPCIRISHSLSSNGRMSGSPTRCGTKLSASKQFAEIAHACQQGVPLVRAPL